MTMLVGNVGRGHAAQVAVLEVAGRMRAELMLVQEPWIGREPERHMTKSHPG